MDKGFEKSWRLIFLTMIMIFAAGFCGFIPFFAEHEYIFITMGEAVMLVPVCLGIRHLEIKSDISNVLLKGFSPKLILILMLIPICMQHFVVFITLPFESLMYKIFGGADNAITPAKSAVELFAQIFSVCLIPALVEEFLCRGIIMRLLKPYGTVIAVTISALAFSMLHFSMTSLVVIFMLGVLLAAVRLLTDSVWACVLVHFANNLAAVIQEQFVLNGGLMIAYEIVAALMFPVLALCLIKQTNPTEKLLTKTQKIEVSPSMILSCIFFGIMIISNAVIQ